MGRLCVCSQLQGVKAEKEGAITWVCCLYSCVLREGRRIRVILQAPRFVGPELKKPPGDQSCTVTQRSNSWEEKVAALLTAPDQTCLLSPEQTKVG